MKIRLSGVKNIRDFSEYGLPGCIRSAHLHNITKEDARILAEEYNLKTIIDLRTSMEVREKPDYEIPGVTILHMPLFDEAMMGISHEESTDKSAVDKDALLSAIPNMPDLYHSLVTEPSSARQIKKIMAIIRDPKREGAVLWHCTEGKDRCGLISALVLMQHGMDYETILNDYLTTNKVNKRKAAFAYAAILLTKRDKGLANKVRDILLAKKEYLDAAYEGLKKLSEKINEKTDNS